MVLLFVATPAPAAATAPLAPSVSYPLLAPASAPATAAHSYVTAITNLKIVLPPRLSPQRSPPLCSSVPMKDRCVSRMGQLMRILSADVFAMELSKSDVDE